MKKWDLNNPYFINTYCCQCDKIPDSLSSTTHYETGCKILIFYCHGDSEKVILDDRNFVKDTVLNLRLFDKGD